MIGAAHGLTAGYVARHLPPGSRVGREVAILDIAQDFLLAHLHEQGVFELVAFKGGTALRKLFAGSQGRFSTDMDLAATDAAADRRELTALIASACTVVLGPFEFRAEAHRERYRIQVTTSLGNPAVSIKLDVGPPCWLAPSPRVFVPHSTHARYGFTLPALPCMRLEEILAEKVARLTRASTARDASDLVWAATTTPHSRFARDTVRRLAMLKVWVDNYGLGPGWSPALAPRGFDATCWLADRDDWDDEQIGLLTQPPPTVQALTRDLQRHYAWLANLTNEESRWAQVNARDRGDVIRSIRTLDGAALGAVELY